MKFPQSLLILIIITLICSITPAMAIQTGNNELDESYDQAYDLVRETVLNNFVEGTNTELTLEQDAYLEQNQDRLENKSDSMLFNLQDLLNYLITEYNNYHPTNENQENPTQRKLLETRDDTNKYTTDAINMKEYISTDDNGPKINGTQNIICNYDELLKSVNENTKEKKVDIDHVIVQIRDPSGYIRYMQLIDINPTDIHLKSGTQDIKVTRERFEALYVWHEDDGVSNPDLKFNILVSPPDYSFTDYILRQIWDKQNSDLRRKEARVSTGISIAVSVIGVAGLGVAIAGAYRLCDSCDSKAADNIEKALPPKKKLNKKSPLLARDGVKNTCSANCLNCLCSKCGKSIIILNTGIFVVLGSAITLYYINKLKLDYDDDHKNLYKYEPPLNK